jgi:hypothetical protein
MTLFEQFSLNKGTVSTALGKTLAQKVLGQNQIGILSECIDLASYDAPAPAAKRIRAGAAKVVELVAEKRPDGAAEKHPAKGSESLAVQIIAGRRTMDRGCRSMLEAPSSLVSSLATIHRLFKKVHLPCEELT